MPGDPERDKLDRLSDRIREAGNGSKTPNADPADPGAFKASRVGFDFVATVAVVTGLGWVADHFLGTSPVGVLTMFFAGFGLGLLNIWRSLNGKT